MIASLRFAGVVVACALIAACSSTPPPAASGATATPPPTTTVSNPVAGIAKMATTDVQGGIDELTAAGAASSTAPLPLQDSLTCGKWLLTAIPQAVALTNGLIPSGNSIKGPYSLFIAGKIAVVNGKAAVSTAQSSFIDTFNHYCGAAIAGDTNAITVLLAKQGIQVAGIAGIVPTGGASGILGGILSGILP